MTTLLQDTILDQIASISTLVVATLMSFATFAVLF
jgi:hypothetical protein